MVLSVCTLLVLVFVRFGACQLRLDINPITVDTDLELPQHVTIRCSLNLNRPKTDRVYSIMIKHRGTTVGILLYSKKFQMSGNINQINGTLKADTNGDAFLEVVIGDVTCDDRGDYSCEMAIRRSYNNFKLGPLRKPLKIIGSCGIDGVTTTVRFENRSLEQQQTHLEAVKFDLITVELSEPEMTTKTKRSTTTDSAGITVHVQTGDIPEESEGSQYHLEGGDMRPNMKIIILTLITTIIIAVLFVTFCLFCTGGPRCMCKGNQDKTYYQSISSSGESNTTPEHVILVPHALPNRGLVESASLRSHVADQFMIKPRPVKVNSSPSIQNSHLHDSLTNRSNTIGGNVSGDTTRWDVLGESSIKETHHPICRRLQSNPPSTESCDGSEHIYAEIGKPNFNNVLTQVGSCRKALLPVKKPDDFGKRNCGSLAQQLTDLVTIPASTNARGTTPRRNVDPKVLMGEHVPWEDGLIEMENTANETGSGDTTELRKSLDKATSQKLMITTNEAGVNIYDEIVEADGPGTNLTHTSAEYLTCLHEMPPKARFEKNPVSDR